jgi:hypothetical protein
MKGTSLSGLSVLLAISAIALKKIKKINARGSTASCIIFEFCKLTTCDAIDISIFCLSTNCLYKSCTNSQGLSHASSLYDGYVVEQRGMFSGPLFSLINWRKQFC